VSSILHRVKHVALYTFDVPSSSWKKAQVEGSLYVVSLADPDRPVGLMVLNRVGSDNFFVVLPKHTQFQHASPFVYIKVDADIWGLWFLSAEEGAAFVSTVPPMVSSPKFIPLPSSHASPSTTHPAHGHSHGPSPASGSKPHKSPAQPKAPASQSQPQAQAQPQAQSQSQSHSQANAPRIMDASSLEAMLLGGAKSPSASASPSPSAFTSTQPSNTSQNRGAATSVDDSPFAQLVKLTKQTDEQAATTIRTMLAQHLPVSYNRGQTTSAASKTTPLTRPEFVALMTHLVRTDESVQEVLFQAYLLFNNTQT
jgi:hypothetical protein